MNMRLRHRPATAIVIVALGLLLLAIGAVTGQGHSVLVPAGRVEVEQLELRNLASLAGEHPRDVLAATPATRGDWIRCEPKCHDITVADRVLEGHSVPGKGGVGKTWFVPRVPKAHHGDAQKFPPLYHVHLDANGASIGPRLRIRYLPGEVIFERSNEWFRASDLAAGWDNPENTIDDVIVKHFYGPLRLRSTDAMLGRIVASDARETCISYESPMQGGELHGYGAGQVAVHFTADGVPTTPPAVYAESAPVGLLAEATWLQLRFLKSINCSDACAVIRKPAGIADSALDVVNVGYRIEPGARDSKIAGLVKVRPGATGVELGASHVRLDLVGGGGKTFLRTTAPVSNCHITALVSGGDEGLDLRQLGWNNLVDVRIKGIAGDRQVLLPANPDPRNTIRVDGRQIFPPIADPAAAAAEPAAPKSAVRRRGAPLLDPNPGRGTDRPRPRLRLQRLTPSLGSAA